MNTLSISPLKGALRFFLATVAALVSFLGSALLLEGFNPFHATPDPAFFRLLVGESLVIGPGLLYLISESRFHGAKLLGLSLVVYIGAAQVLGHFEMVAFNFMFHFGPAEFAYLIGQQALTALILVPLVVTIAGKWKIPAVLADDRVGDWLPKRLGFWVRFLVLAVLWYFSYMLAGFFIADPITHAYYEAKLPDLNSINAWLPFLQLFRGMLWTLLFVLAVRVMNRSLTEAGLVVGLLFGVFHAASLLLPNPLMPNEMRLSHLPEIVLSLVWQGSLTVLIMGWRKKQQGL